MKIVVAGSSGRIGRRIARDLRKADCRVAEVSRSAGVDLVTGVGLAQAMWGAEVVIDVTNSPDLQGEAAMRFFQTATSNLLHAGKAAGVRQHIVLSIAGLDGLLSGGYFRAKKMQEDLVKRAGLPFTIVRATQFFEFISDVVQAGTAREIAISSALAQPIAGDDVASMLAGAILTEPFNTTIEIGGPERLRLDEVATEIATLREDDRRIIADIHAPYFGLELRERSLLPGPDAHIGPTTFDAWLRDSLRPSWDGAVATSEMVR